MKRLILVLSLLFFFCAAAQEQLAPPSMPAALIIGIQPDDIAVPKNMRELEAALYGGYFGSGGFNITGNFALEINPWLIFSRGKDDTICAVNGGLLKNIYRTLSFSVSSTDQFLLKDSLKSKAMGFGIRTKLLRGYPSKTDTAFTNPTDTIHGKRNIGGGRIKYYGLIIEAAAAVALNFPTNKFDYAAVSSWGIWLMSTYRKKELNGLVFSAFFRGQLNSTSFYLAFTPPGAAAGNIFDTGCGAGYELEKFSFELEYIYHFNHNNYSKYIFGINYNISDDIILSYNFGKDYGVISSLALNFGF